MQSKPDTPCFLCLFSLCCPKCDTSCVGLVHCWRWNLDLLKWAEFWSCWLNHEKRLKSWNKIEILKSWESTWEPIPESWNKIEILKLDWNPETRSDQEKQKLLHLCSTIALFCAPAWPPVFCAENRNSDNNWSCHLPASALDFDCYSCKYFPRSC